MRRYVFALVCLATTAANALAWNDKGHMVVARIAWMELKPEERAKIGDILKSHPHYNEFLRADRPANIPEDEWVFLRAATWADWVRSGPPERRKFGDSPAHYINLPYVPPGSSANPPAVPANNVVKKLAEHAQNARMGGDRIQRAVDTTWVFHLTGDIHQPMHCITLFNEDFPDGDRGGNRSLFRMKNSTIQMHHYWDGLLGTSTTLSSIGGTVHEIDTLLQQDPNVIKADLAANKTPESWANESFENGKRFGYLNGALQPAPAEDHPTTAQIPKVPATYAEDAGRVARLSAAKGGKRLAQLLREIAAAN
jgi:hypothetical protein